MWMHKTEARGYPDYDKWVDQNDFTANFAESYQIDIYYKLDLPCNTETQVEIDDSYKNSNCRKSWWMNLIIWSISSPLFSLYILTFATLLPLHWKD